MFTNPLNGDGVDVSLSIRCSPQCLLWSTHPSQGQLEHMSVVLSFSNIKSILSTLFSTLLLCSSSPVCVPSCRIVFLLISTTVPGHLCRDSFMFIKSNVSGFRTRWNCSDQTNNERVPLITTHGATVCV